MRIHAERPEDELAVGSILEKAFAGPAEAALVTDLRKCRDVISLVAVEEGEVAGHILFSPVQLLLDGEFVADGSGLAPMAVAADRQRSGIGGSLIKAGWTNSVRITACSWSYWDTLSTTLVSDSSPHPEEASAASTREFPTRPS